MVGVSARTSSEPVSKAQPDVSQGISRVIIMDHAATLSQSTSKSPLLSSPLLLMIQYPEAASHKPRSGREQGKAGSRELEEKAWEMGGKDGVIRGIVAEKSGGGPGKGAEWIGFERL